MYLAPRTKPLRFYDYKTAASARRVRIFIAGKSLQIETIEVDLAHAEHLGAAFKLINPRCTVPILVLEDGTTLTENAGIAAFLEAYQPDPPLLGTNATEKGLIANWNARVELEGRLPLADAFRNRTKGLKDRATIGPTNYPQIPELAERGWAQGAEFFAMLDQRLANVEYLAGTTFSLADITALVVIDFAAWIKLGPADEHMHTKRWLALVRQRPSCSL